MALHAVEHRDHYPSGLSALCRQRMLLPIQALTGVRKINGLLTGCGAITDSQRNWGFGPFYLLSAYVKGFALEPQENLPDLPRDCR